MTGGKAGTNITLQVNFGASSPVGGALEMRVREAHFRRCFSEEEMSQSQWEPIASAKTYSIYVAINFTSFDVTAQYRDAKGNLSQVYCADIAVEGMP